MLQVTDAAAEAIRQMRSQSEAPDDAAARIQLMTAGGEQGLGFAFTTEHLEDDQKVIENDDLEIYLSSELADPLADAVIDADTGQEGTRLVLREQGEAAG